MVSTRSASVQFVVGQTDGNGDKVLIDDFIKVILGFVSLIVIVYLIAAVVH